jgi:hypothetical protein
VSFDLLVWHESAPITADEARAKLERRGDDGVFHDHPAVAAFRDALLQRFPALESLSEKDLDGYGVWSVTPQPSTSLLELSCVWSRASEVGAAVVDLAGEHGLICYEPGMHVVNPNVPGYNPPFLLSSARFPDIPDPDARRLEWAVRRLGDDNDFAILDRDDGWFAQVGWGERAGVPVGTYVLEYQEGTADRHFRSETWDVAEVVQFLQDFLADDQSWKQRHQWKPLTL